MILLNSLLLNRQDSPRHNLHDNQHRGHQINPLFNPVDFQLANLHLCHQHNLQINHHLSPLACLHLYPRCNRADSLHRSHRLSLLHNPLHNHLLNHLSNLQSNHLLDLHHNRRHSLQINRPLIHRTLRLNLQFSRQINLHLLHQKKALGQF